MTLPHSTLARSASKPQLLFPRSALNSRASNESSLLECLQVSPPVLSPEKPTCQQTLMVHTFGLSYGKPFVGEYQPPNCTFNRVTFNFTVTSAGRQFDRLALMFFGDTEIFRTSTAEPTRGGIIWTYVKDMSNYQSLFKTPQKIIFDLGNLVDDTYTGSWNTTLTATFFTAEDTIHPADVILPVSARKSIADGPSGFVVPETKAIDSLTLPQNAKKAVFSISACGQATEEFWWSNVLSSDTQVFGNETTLYGNSPFRELQLFIDGMLAGVAWPFPVIFTGGIIPGFWRPVVGIDAFDLKEDEIDISPFIGLLSDGKLHSFEIRVVGIDDDGQGKGKLTEAIGSNWVVTGKVFVWVDPDSEVTKGTLPTIDAPNPSLSLSSTVNKTANGTVQSLDYSVQVSRNLVISSNISTSSGTQTMVWQQSLTFYNKGQLTNAGNDQIMRQKTTGSETSPDYSKNFEYPLGVTSSYNEPPGGNLTIEGQMERGKYVRQLGDLAFPNEWKTFDYSRVPMQYKTTHVGVTSNNWQNGTATYLGVPAQKRSYGSGSTEQLYSLSSIGEDTAATVQDSDSLEQGGNGAELYRRHIIAANDSVIYDEVSFGGLTTFESRYNMPMTYDKVEGHGFAETGVRQMLGRGPF